MRGSFRRKSRDRLPVEIDLLFRPPASAEVIRLLTRQNALDPLLMPTDRHMQRWAVGQGTGLPNPDRALFVRSRLTPLPDPEAIATDKVVLTSPADWRRFVNLWFLSDCSTDQIAERLRMSRRSVLEERKVVLSYLLGRLTGAGVRISYFEAGA